MSHNGTQFGADHSIDSDLDGLRDEFDAAFQRDDDGTRASHTCDCVGGTGSASYCCV